MARVGILGGTFNPLHIGHLACAQEALLKLELDEVALMPVAAPPHKEIEADPGAAHRLAMCRLAAGADPRFSVCALEVERGGRSYTVDTLRGLHARTPGNELTFIVGADMALSLPTWREPEQVLDLAVLAVAEREGVRRMDILECLAGLRGIAERVRFFDMPRIDVSSSLIRRRVAAGEPIRYLVPDAVREYIAAEALYGAKEVAA